MKLRVLLFALLLAPQGCILVIPGAVVGGGAGALMGRDIRVKEGAAIEVSFERPQDAALVARSGGDTTFLAGATRLVGRLREMRDDTLWVTVSEASVAPDKRVRWDKRRAPETVVIRQPGVSVRALGDQVTYIATGAVLGAGVSILIFYLLCLQTNCLD